MAFKKVFRNIRFVYTLAAAEKKSARQITKNDLSILKQAAMYVENGVIQAIGPEDEVLKMVNGPFDEIDCRKRVVLPGLIESHTHTVFAGSRSDEFERRLQGESYQEIARSGGGILSTVQATRKCSASELLHLSQKRAQRFLSQGVTTLEVKSGYALNLDDEVKMLEVAEALRGPKIVSTFLGAHAVSPEHQTAEEYLQWMAQSVLPLVAQKKLASRVDIFVEKGYFNSAIAKPYLQAAQKLGYDVVVHADQLSLCGGTELAIELGAKSADHLLQISDVQVKQLANSNVTCGLLPAADLYMKSVYPQARALIDQGARVALASDFNPGSSPTQDISLVGLLARLEMKMSWPEVLCAYTLGAAYALGVEAQCGSLSPGKKADFIVLEDEAQDLFYQAGQSPVVETWVEGERKNILTVS